LGEVKGQIAKKTHIWESFCKEEREEKVRREG